MKISFRIREIRRQQGLTTTELAKRAELSQSYISDIERGAVTPSVKSLSKIAVALGMSLKDLIVEEE